MIDRENKEISLTRQAELLDISRSSIYYKPKINEKELKIKNVIDKIYTDCPFYGARRIKRELLNQYGVSICREYTRNLMRSMGLEAIYPKKNPNLSKANLQHKKYPYLLKNLKIVRPNQVWGTDITYIRLVDGFIYLTAIMDWYSRYVVSWELSETLENNFCIQALKEALEEAKPEIHNSDQGSQFTADNYLKILREAEVTISMDGRGRYLDNIFTERLWRTLKYENIYINEYQDIEEARQGIFQYFQFYNHRRIHQALNYETPAEIYFSNKQLDNQLIIKNQTHLNEANILS